MRRTAQVPPPADRAIPAYQRIKDYVLAQVQQGIWAEGDLIPTELALCRHQG